MATKKSKIVMEQRKHSFDRVSFIAPKSAKYLIRAQALREGISSAEVMRRAVLARCGVTSWPTPAQPHHMGVINCNDRESAKRALEGIQLDEYVTDKTADPSNPNDLYMTVMLSSQAMKEEYIKALLDLLDVIEDTTTEPGTEKAIKFSKKNMATIHRLLANIDEIPDDDEAFYGEL